MAYVEETAFITISSRSASSTGSMGIRHGGHVTAACVGFYADCSAAGCRYFAAYNTGAYKSWHRESHSDQWAAYGNVGTLLLLTAQSITAWNILQQMGLSRNI